jgi:hypothetical protein
MEFEKLNLVELNAQELQKTDGGRAVGWFGVAFVVVDFLFDVHDEFVKIYKPH